MKRNDAEKYSRKTYFYFSIAFLFLVIFGFKLVNDFTFGGVGYRSYVPIVLFTAAFSLRFRWLWLLGFVYCLFGLYFYYVTAPQASWHREYEFTLPVVRMLFGDHQGINTSSPMVGILFSISFFFYNLYVLVYVANKVRLLLSAIYRRFGNGKALT